MIVDDIKMNLNPALKAGFFHARDSPLVRPMVLLWTVLNPHGMSRLGFVDVPLRNQSPSFLTETRDSFEQQSRVNHSALRPHHLDKGSGLGGNKQAIAQSGDADVERRI